MNYRHAFHAGNFADVLKHAVLTAVLLRLRQRPKPLCYVESHAGSGLYALDGPEARRSREAEGGILRFSGTLPGPPALDAYLQIVAALPENAAALRVYPGSPLVAAALLGEQDRLLLTEMVPAEAQALRRLFRHDPRVGVHCRDGWEAIGALLPPLPRRGLLLIDPPYEAEDEFRRVGTALALARRRWPEGVLAAWYPVKDRRSLRAFHESLEGLGPGGVLRVELSVRPDDNPAGLNGSGLVICGPPWGLEDELRGLLETLWESMRQSGAPRPRLDWVHPPES